MMAHVVPTKFGNAGILEQPPPRGADLAEPLAVVVDENPPFPCQRLLAPALQYERCLAIERDMPCAPRFCGRAGHGHDAPFEIDVRPVRSEEHTSEPQSLMRISYAVFCLKKKKQKYTHTPPNHQQ